MLVSIGLDFRRAGLEVRERFHLEDHDVPRVYEQLASRGVREAVLTRTCNRLEAYCWWPATDPGWARLDHGHEICRAWVGGDEPEAEILRSHAHLRRDQDVARHLFRVASGLESQILGDMHILGQLRRAFRDAVEAEWVGSNLHRLFETALRVGKRVKRETPLTATRSGVGSEAARRAMVRWGGLAGRACVVVGSGKIGTHAARSLAQLGATDLTIVNRTLHRAEKLAGELGTARALGLAALPSAVAAAAVVIVATEAQEPVLTAPQVRAARSGQASGEGAEDLLVIDISVPRNVATDVGRVPGVELVDLDTLHPEAAEAEKCRAAAIPAASALVEEGVEEFVGWLELESARRALRPFHEILTEVCRREVSHLAGESSHAARTAERIVARVMAHPMIALRAASQRGEPLEEAAGAIGALFANARSA